MIEPKGTIGLDIGTSRLVSAGKEEDRFQLQSQLNAFLPLPFSKLTEGILKKENVKHNSENGELVVYGNDSERFANLFHLETRRPMTRGLLNPNENGALGVIKQIASSLLNSERSHGRHLYFTSCRPGRMALPVGSPDDLTPHITKPPPPF